MNQPPSDAQSGPIDRLPGGHSLLWRTREAEPTGAGRRLVVKATGLDECVVHALVSSELPGVAPSIVSWQPADSAWHLVMEDLTAAGYRTLDDLAADGDAGRCQSAFVGAWTKLASLHTCFADRHRASKLTGIRRLEATRPGDAEFARALPAALNALSSMIDLGMPREQITALASVGARYEQLVQPVLEYESETLVHGDFHQRNIMANAEDVRIIDWGSAGVSLPQWDLIFCDSAGLRDYFAQPGTARMHPDRSRFVAAWRGTVVTRMCRFLQSAMHLLLDDEPVETALPMVNGMGIYVTRLLAAADCEAAVI